MVRSMMSHVDLPNSFWGHALLTIAYTLNYIPSKKVVKTPYEIWSEPPIGVNHTGCKWVLKKKTDMDGKVDVKNTFKYLRRTKDSFLIYEGQEELAVIGYIGAIFQTNKDDFRSQFDYVFYLNGGVVSWKSSKQDTIVDSTTEAKYIAASSAERETDWIKKFISKLGIVPSIMDPIDLYCDDNGAIAQAKEPRTHQRSKHILRRYHLIREIIDRGDVKICKVSTLDNIADPLTKPLAQQKHDGHTRSMGIRGMPD
ncbi:hypothetical protein KIW84_030993 [Lathyrus oleraceus]|uniref:Retrotransposon protein, putative, Ty1-copia subclass n=1 Tax=Pisum sativum TaxID=3888 RepID=A0A9D4XR66_PEA|nr:hypothetical protein KIW84_030993 [Pisum sativum]